MVIAIRTQIRVNQMNQISTVTDSIQTTAHVTLQGMLWPERGISTEGKIYFRLTGAAGLLARWRQADERINDYIAVGNYRAATQVALGTAADDSTPAFDRLNDALSGAIEESRRQLRGDILSALRVLSGTTVGGALLAVGAALAVALGLAPRMNEYR